MSRSALALVSVTMAVGCRLGTVSPEEFDREYPVARLTTIAPPGLGDSIAELRAAAGGPVRITMLTFFDERTQITAQNPREPSNFDRYTFWQGDVSSDAVSTSGGQEQRLKQQLFDLDLVPLDRLSELARNAYKALPIAGARVSYVTVRLRNPRENAEADASTIGLDDLDIEMTIDGERRDGRVVYDGRGNLRSAKEQ